MDIRRLTDLFSAAPQITPADMPAVAEAGFRAVICNRPDGEVTPDLQTQAMAEAAKAAGLAFHIIPVGHDGLRPEMLTETAEVLDGSAGPVLAYCRSGTRSTHVWALTMAGRMPTDDIIKAAAEAGYDIAAMRPHLEALASKG